MNSSFHYTSAKLEAIQALQSMTNAMKAMGAEHVKFHNNFDTVQNKIQDMKDAYGDKELHVEVIRFTALEGYFSNGNLPIVTLKGHLEVEKVLKKFQQQEEELEKIYRKTATLVESLLGDRRCMCRDGHGARA